MWDGRPEKQNLQPAITRCSRYAYYTFKAIFCDMQSAFLTVCMLAALVFWIVSCFVGDAPKAEYDPIVVSDADPAKETPTPSTGGL